MCCIIGVLMPHIWVTLYSAECSGWVASFSMSFHVCREPSQTWWAPLRANAHRVRRWTWACRSYIMKETLSKLTKHIGFVSICYRPSDQVFGCRLEMLCERERNTVPRFVRLCTEAVEKRGTAAEKHASLLKWSQLNVDERNPSSNLPLSVSWQGVWAHDSYRFLTETLVVSTENLCNGPAKSRNYSLEFRGTHMTAASQRKIHKKQ